jgi:hypothetical protein
VLTRPAGGASWVCRKIDLFVLSNRPGYVPRVEDLHPRGYLRFTNRSAGQEPFCLWLHVRRQQGPQWYANPGILSRAGLSEGYSVPADKSKWLASGRRSPWVPIRDYLLAAGGRNNLQIVATRKRHCVGQGSPKRMRMKYYTLVAGGVRDIECYDYGPWYAGIDSWGRNFDLYPAIRLAALPGVSYVHESIQPPYSIDSYLPTNFRAGLRDFLAWPARLAGAPRVAAARCTIAEIVRYDGPDRIVVFVIDHRAEPVERFIFDLFDAAGWTRATAASGARVELAPSAGGVLRVTLPLSAADALVLSKSGLQ